MTSLEDEIDWTRVAKPVERYNQHFYDQCSLEFKAVLDAIGEKAGVDYNEALGEFQKNYSAMLSGGNLPRTGNDLYDKLYPQTQTSQSRFDVNDGLSEQKKSQMFQTPYIDTDNLVNLFLSFLRSGAKSWDALTYLAPYSAMIQSSGVGKTRLVIEASSHCWGFYICCRHGNLGYPRRSSIADYLTQISLWAGSPHLFYPGCLHILFFVACLDSLADHITSLQLNGQPPSREQYEAWRDLQLVDDVDTTVCGTHFWDAIINRHKALIRTFFPEDTGTKSPRRYAERFTTAAAPEIERLMESCSKVASVLGGKVDPENNPPLVLFAFDEAQTLVERPKNAPENQISVFNLVRSALSTFPAHNQTKVHVFATMLDTHGQLSKLHPKNLRDKSLRFVSGKKLYEPFWPFPFCRIPADSTQPHAVNFVNSGRFLWKSMSDSGVSWETIVQIACLKLSLNSNISKLESDTYSLMAVASVRLCLQFLSSSTLVETLVHSNMATCTYISPDQERLMIHYPSEPALAFAANMLTLYEKYDWECILKELDQQIRSGIVENGYRGELVARVLLSCAWDLCWKDAMGGKLFAERVGQIQPVPLAVFLNNLGGSLLIEQIESIVDDQEKELLLEGTVFFTHFFYATQSQTAKSLERCYNQSAAVLCKRCERAIDLIVPVQLPDKRMTHVSVQVKNYSREKKSEELVMLAFDRAGDLDLCENDTPYLALFLQVGNKTKPAIRCVSKTKAVPYALRSNTTTSTSYFAFGLQTLYVEPDENAEAVQEPKKKKRKKNKIDDAKEVAISTLDDVEEELQQKVLINDQKKVLEERKGIIISMVSLKPATYPNIQVNVLKSLESLSECWSDPMCYSRSKQKQGTSSLNTMPAIKTWFELNDPTLVGK